MFADPEALYRQTTAASRALHERAVAVMPGGTTRTTTYFDPYPLYIERGEVFWTSRDDNGALADWVSVRPRGGRARSLRMPEMRVDRWGTLTEFANAIREGREPECSGRENVATIAFMAAAVESARRGAPVTMSGEGAALEA